MNDLQDVITRTSMKAYNAGLQREREHLIQLLREFKEKTECQCTGCDSWKNAFDWIVLELENEKL
jgi:hypothetical protein